jgi:hypothetical protein
VLERPSIPAARNVQPLQHHDEPSGDHQPVSGDQPLSRQPKNLRARQRAVLLVVDGDVPDCVFSNHKTPSAVCPIKYTDLTTRVSLLFSSLHAVVDVIAMGRRGSGEAAGASGAWRGTLTGARSLRAHRRAAQRAWSGIEVVKVDVPK